ncbi:MAG: YmfQ family protein [Hyphomicrobiaceae bacterium]
MPSPKRDASTFAHAFMALLPEGPIWPRARGTTLLGTVLGLMGIVARWAADAWRFLHIEAYPPTALDLLADWERVLGLPEPCLPVTDLTIAERQAQVREKLARRPGAQSRQYFFDLAARLGYAVTITEYIPAQCGITQCGATRVVDGPFIVRGAGCGTPYIRFVWTVSVPAARLTWFAVGAGGGRAGQDPHLRIRRAEDLECILQMLKPAHTRLIFDYSGI